ncbi:signal transduction histidine kinase [Sulfurimonas gotlandica GD1]|uniref:histidine kinase n=1 Tax=Sulfurimonas gotlandica (strain DSM 19862 / JCM 16533 / GD1) TaxID=929558 RepID=B6BK34_SULGG|nr:transporter substrate-binding domain-containing protein [Sulfurimonas gotlandica]EDZ62650.1 PAS/PAC sensor hybrid histidine kinase [Sulfurimonas gotlandica GD1]EHP31125.1 signal transduction histidine kinase [Sulfurimonas gotlandica GD1]
MKPLLVYLASFVLFVTSLFSSELNLSKDEIEWIKNNPVVKFGADKGWPPFDFLDKNGNYAGLSSEYIKIIEKKSGLKIKVYPVVWADALKSAKSKEYDGLTCVVETEDRKKYLRFSDAYLNVPMVIINRSKNSDIKSMEDLVGKSVSINKDSYVHEWLKSNHPKIKLHLTKSNEESLEAVSVGKAEAYIGNLAVATYIINKYLINNLKVITKVKGFNTSIGMAVDKDNEILFSIIQKSLKSITTQEDQEIKSRWRRVFSLEEKSQLLEFSKKQQDWISRHQVIEYTGDPDWLPFEAADKDKQHIGIAAEYVKEIQKYTGITFKYVASSTWQEAISKVKDASVSMIVETIDSKLDLQYTQAFISNSIIIVMNDDSSYVENLNMIADKKIAVIKEYGYVPKLRQEYKNIVFYEVNNIQEGLSAISTGKYDALLCTFTLGSYMISEMGLHNVQIVGKTMVSADVGFGVVKEYSPLVEIINKVLNSIDKKQKHDILTKWTNQKYVEKVDYTLVWQLVGIFIFFIFGTLYWNRKLSVEIAKRKQAQEELFEVNKKLEEAKDIAVNANKAKSDFLSNMSHEIRTPMNAILGFAELLDKRVEDKKSKSFIKTIRSSGQTLLYLINDILNLSKIESGKLELVKSRVNIQNICEETINIFKLQAKQKGLQLQLDINKEMPKAILIDSIRLSEILINLIGNAIKFTEEGYVKLVVNVDEVYEHTSKVDLTIRVEDSGIGIEKINQDKIFNIFEQTENQDVKKYGGTGLGLAISRKLSKLMGGSLEVESVLGKGSSFIIEFKSIDIASVSDEEHVRESEEIEENIKFEKSVVLVVDDVQENRDLVRESLVEAGVEILEAVNGKEAIEVFNRKDIDLILMDIRMPIMDGYTATKLIKASSSVPIVALTASIMQDELKKLEDERFDGYLRKPVSKKALYKEISKFLDFKSTPSSSEKSIDDISVDNTENLIIFLNRVEKEIEELYVEALQTNDINKIENFALILKEIASEYMINYIIKYSEELLEKVDSFDITGISLMLDKYENIIKDLKSKL